MKFFDGVLKCLGFESEEKDVGEKKEKIKKEKKVEKPSLVASYNFEEEAKEAKKKPVNVVAQSQADVQVAIDNMKNGQDVIINLDKFTQSDYCRALDFLSGAVYATDGKLKRMENKTFLLTNKE